MEHPLSFPSLSVYEALLLYGMPLYNALPLQKGELSQTFPILGWGLRLKPDLSVLRGLSLQKVITTVQREFAMYSAQDHMPRFKPLRKGSN